MDYEDTPMTTLADLRRAIEESHCKAGNFGLTCPACALFLPGECWKPKVIAVLDVVEQELRENVLKLLDDGQVGGTSSGYDGQYVRSAHSHLYDLLGPAADTAPVEDVSDSGRSDVNGGSTID